MARKRHGGLGRGLDALIPQTFSNRGSGKDTDGSETEKTADVERTEKADLTGPGTEADPTMKTGPAAGDGGTSGTELAAETGGTSGTAPAAETGGTSGTAPAAETGGVSGTAPAAETGGMSEAGLSAESDAASWDSRTVGTSPASGTSADPESPESKIAEKGETAERKVEELPEGIRMLRLSQVDPNRSQPREKFEDEALEELAASIRQFGVLQPILVQKKDGRYEIIAGERRWRASRRAGLKEIPAIVRDYSDQETLELSLIENIQREDLNPIEEAKAFRRLLDEFGLRQEDLAARVCKSRTAITNAVRLLKLDERVQEMLVQGEISMGHARALLPLEIEEEQFLVAQEILQKHLNVREVEKLVRSRLSGKTSKKKDKPGRTGKTDPALELAYRSIEEQLKQSLGTRAVIHGSGDGTGRLEIDFYSSEDLEKLVDLLT